MNPTSWHSTMTQLAGALERRHPKERKLLGEIACSPGKRCPSSCLKCGRRHMPPPETPNHEEPMTCDDMPTESLCRVCEIVTLFPLAASCIDPGDGLRSPNTEGGSRSIGTHSAPTEATAINHVDREAGTLRLVDAYMADAEEALRLALSTVEDA